MSVTILDKTDDVRKKYIRMICESYFQRFPKQARAIARFLKEVTSHDLRDGKWKGGDAYVKVRFPSPLFHSLRRGFAKANIFPNFGDDDADIRFVVNEYPDLFKKTTKAKKHHLPKFK